MDSKERNEGQIAAACFSSVCSVFLLYCFYAFPHWREDPFGTKHVLLVLTLFNLGASLNYVVFHPISSDGEVTSRGLCYLQSGTMQIFELGGSWLWTAIFSFEVARFGCKSLSEALVNRVTRAQSSINRPGIFSPHEIYKRRTLFFYHLGSFVWITVPTVLLFSLGASGPAGNWCWTSSSDWIMYSYICLWLEFFVILVASIVVSRLVFKTRAKQHNHDNQARLVDIVIAQRLMLVPLMYILLHVPGTIRRLDKIWGKPAGDTTKFLQASGRWQDCAVG